MREMIKNVDAAVVPWDAAHSIGHGWRPHTHVYPTAIAVRHRSGPEVFVRDEKTRTFAESERWDVAHVGAYTVVTFRDFDGTVLYGVDHLIPLPSLAESVEDRLAVLTAAHRSNVSYLMAASERVYGLLADTARCIVAGWWVMTATHADLGKSPHFEALVRACVWRPGTRMPTGIAGPNADLRQPLPINLE